MKRFILFALVLLTLGTFSMAENLASLEAGYALSSGSGQLIPGGGATGTVAYAQVDSKTQLLTNAYFLAGASTFTPFVGLSPSFRANLGFSGFLGRFELGAILGASYTSTLRFDGVKFFGRYQFIW